MPKSSTDPRGGWQQLPLPGSHACITWQLNVTFHPGQRGMKYVSVLRDPDVQVELARVGCMLTDDDVALDSLQEHLPAVLTQLLYLACLPEELVDLRRVPTPH